MKQSRILFLGFIIVLTSCGKDNRLRKLDHFDSFSQIERLFPDPPAGFRTAPFWVWNGEVTEEMIDKQLEDLNAKGFGGVFVHPRYGLITEYLSQEWFSLVAYATGKAESLGMKLWLYDENSFPSGFAGGHVPAEMPESWNQGQALALQRMYVLNPRPNVNYKHIYIRTREGFREVTNELSSLMGRKGDFYLLELLTYPKSKWYGGYSYVDLIRPGVTEKFIELTMTGYEESIGNYFGTVVPGIFTDEPNIAPQGREGSIRWTPDLYDRFYEQWGYRLEPNLLSLLRESGDWQKVRHDYYSLLLDLFIDSWSKPWYEYTESRGLQWTGHYWEHGWPSPHHGGDNMAMYAWHQVPGIDMLFNTWEGRPDQFGNIRAVKELSSVANQLGRTRTLSETYGASGWELSFEDMKRNGEWQYVLGVNFMNQHLTYQTIMGDRKHDFPQSFSPHNAWWELYRRQADHFARLSLSLSSGEQVNHVLVLEPTTSAWMYYAPGTDNKRLDQIRDSFHGLLSALEEEHVEYDIGCERIMRDHASVADSQLVVGQRSYQLVIIPEWMHNVQSCTAGLLLEYLEKGGRLMVVKEMPYLVDGSPDHRLAGAAKTHAGQVLVSGPQKDGWNTHLPRPEGFSLRTESGDPSLFFHQRRLLKDGQLLFLVNSAREEEVTGKGMIAGKELLLLDLTEGKILRYPSGKNGDSLDFSFTVPAGGSLLLFAAGDKLKKKYPVFEPADPSVVLEPVDSVKVIPLDDNVYCLDYVWLSLPGQKEQFDYYYTQANRIWQFHGFPDNPWVSSVQYRTGILDRDHFGEGTGFSVRYPFRLTEGFLPEQLHLVVERAELYTVKVNDSVVHRMEDEWWLDEAFGVFETGHLLKEGENNITCHINPMSVHAELAPVFLKGAFDVTPMPSGWVVGPPTGKDCGAWTEQGMSFYAGAVKYSMTYRSRKGREKPVLELQPWEGVVAEVRVNGKKAGIIDARPWRLDLSGTWKKGDNEVSVLVYGSLKNLLGPHHQVNQRGLVTPWSFKYAPARQPAGKEYDLVPYGLYEPFRVMVSE